MKTQSSSKVQILLGQLLELNNRYHAVVKTYNQITESKLSSEYQKGVIAGKKSELETVFKTLDLPLPKIS